ncbi:hypothetical protein GCM10009550_04850 [Actinocorallia libanotica]|uniref:Uncharacterized protein n=1 Tax=Actinocorallia libanotica TaxID=46162 RepID=A0ABP4AKL4_9ACTN
MFTMPKSTPRKPTGSSKAGSGTSQVAYRYHLPPRNTRSDSPRRCSVSIFHWAGEHWNGMFFTRPWTVQIETVRVSSCQDRQRSSNGWAASLRKRTGLDSTARRRLEPTGRWLPALRFAFKVA